MQIKSQMSLGGTVAWVLLLSVIHSVTSQQFTPIRGVRIAGGRAATLGEFPYAVGIRFIDSKLPFCGGALITQNHILTAAHCVRDVRWRLKPSELEVIVGKVNALDDMQGSAVQVERFTIYQGYKKRQLKNDIAILRLRENVTLSDTVQMISVYEGEVTDGMVLTATGWGYTDATNVQPSIMQTVDVPVNSAACDELDSNSFCAGTGNGKDSCAADSGGIVSFRDEDGSWKAVGIVSSGYPGNGQCGEAGVAGVYTKLPNFMTWIHENAGHSTSFSLVLLATTICLLIL